LRPWESPSLVVACMTWCSALRGCLEAKFDSCYYMLTPVHTLHVHILRCVRLYIKRKYKKNLQMARQISRGQTAYKYMSISICLCTVTATVQYMVNRKKHWKYWLNIIPRTALNRIQPTEALFSVTLNILHEYNCISITQNTDQLHFNYKIQITFVRITKYKIYYTHFQYVFVFQLLQDCSRVHYM